MNNSQLKYKLYISPCPNDTFIFEALILGKIKGFPVGSLNTQFADIETLNQLALRSEADIIKVSFGIIPQLLNNYNLLQTGSAMGFGVGPLIVSKSTNLPNKSLIKIVLPGKNTTANLLFDLYYREQLNAWHGKIEKHFSTFSEIAPAVQKGTYDAGILIHEERFTYQKLGLVVLADLGSFWENKFKLPVPLGAIMAKKSIPETEKLRIEQAIAESLKLAKNQYPYISEFVRKHAQSMHPTVMRQHIDLYVNEYSIKLDEKALKAIELITRINTIN